MESQRWQIPWPKSLSCGPACIEPGTAGHEEQQYDASIVPGVEWKGQRVAAGPVELPQPSHLHDLHAPLAFEGPPEGAPEGEDWKETGADGFTVSEGADHVAAKRT